jgi:hypothetical protein
MAQGGRLVFCCTLELGCVVQLRVVVTTAPGALRCSQRVQTVGCVVGVIPGASASLSPLTSFSLRSRPNAREGFNSSLPAFCLLDSYEYFAGGKLITVFSARDYCNRIRNSGAMLEISRELSILPKVIHTKFEESSTLYAPLLPPLKEYGRAALRSTHRWMLAYPLAQAPCSGRSRAYTRLLCSASPLPPAYGFHLAHFTGGWRSASAHHPATHDGPWCRRPPRPWPPASSAPRPPIADS